MSSFVLMVGVSSLVLMVHVPCMICFMWPFWVASDSGKCLVTVASVRPGKVVRSTCHIVDISVTLIGNSSG